MTAADRPLSDFQEIKKAPRAELFKCSLKIN